MAKRKTRKPTTALARRRDAQPPAPIDMTNPAATFASLARDKSVDADKLEKLVHLQERIMDRNAKMAFNAAFTAMADQLPVINRRGIIMSKDKTAVRSRYARLEDIQRILTPILKRHGFSIRHRTEWPRPGIIRVVGILSHIEGHSEESAFEAGPDKNEYRTAIQDEGSTVSYGRRYTIIDLTNIQQEGLDNDGNDPRDSPNQPSETRHTDGSGGDVISDAQRRRMFTIASHAGRKEDEIKKWLAGSPWNLTSTKLLKRRDYEQICKAIEAPGPLQNYVDQPREREPGEEG